ncbi:HEPN domain-containing protein [Stenotrophomonas pavanii]|uniref:HEPN domain-containing protein n=1 Tax=Stenotrophomonas pavanii TaxID=487698 RepID=UPI00383B015E
MSAFEDFVANANDVRAVAGLARDQIMNHGRDGRRLGNATCRAALVLLCGHFEGFVREVVREVVADLADGEVESYRVPSGIIKKVLIDKVKKGIDIEFVDQFRASMRHGPPLGLSPKVMISTDSNPTVAKVDELFSILGIEDVIDQLSIADYPIESTYAVDSQSEPFRGRFAKIINELGVAGDDCCDEMLALIDEKWAPRKKRRSVGYVACIQELLKKRNRIAHGEGGEQITPEELENFCEEIQSLCSGLKAVADSVLVSVRANRVRESSTKSERWNYLLT